MGGGTELGLILVLAAVFILPIPIAINIWTKKGGSGGIGFLMGLVLGWIGVIVAAVANPSGAGEGSRKPDLRGVPTRDCPHCKQRMRADASVCLSCQRESEPSEGDELSWV